MTTDELADTEVICPGCAHHFPAIPMATQTRLRELQAENTRLREALVKHGIEVPHAAD